MSAGFAHSEIILTTPIEGATVSCVSDEFRAFLDLKGEARRTKYSDLDYRTEMLPLVQPVSTTFTWDCTSGEGAPYTVLVSEKKDFSTLATVLDVTSEEATNSMRRDLVNFLIGHTYYWKVIGNLSGTKVESKVGTFQTDPRPPRLIQLPKVGNVRDIGGWTGLDGRKLRQGMIFRSNGLNYNSPDRYDEAIKSDQKRPGRSRLTDQGLSVVNEMLCWKTELDLRGPDEVGSMPGSPAGPSVRWVNHPSSNYKSIYKGNAAAMTGKNFRLFLDPANYPVDIHCISGADRTGSLVFILNGILGVDLDDLSRGWEISWYSPLNYKERFDPLVAGLEAFGKPDDPIIKKIEAYLYAQGITPEEVEKFREIMLEPK